MFFAGTVMMLATVVTSQKSIAVDVEIHPKAVISEQQSLDLSLVQNAIARNLTAVGIDVIQSPYFPRLKVYVMIVRFNKSLAVKQTVTIAVYGEMLDGEGQRNPSPLSVQAASCSASTSSGLNYTTRQEVQLAVSRCIDRLAEQISINIVRLRKTKFVQ